MTPELSAITAFLPCATPKAWLERAVREPALLLIDHANCEKKAAATAMNLMYRYVDRMELLVKMSQLAREELLHFEQVVALMQELGIAYAHLGPARYAAGLRQHLRTHEPAKLVDTLIVGAYVEARSCERFAALLPHLEPRIARFYASLLRSELRHFQDYLALAQLYASEDISARVAWFRTIEQELIESPDMDFRFHSGVPVTPEG
ncbi:MAG: tRNA isopentenyl-2-thiomethyl-A-37 hydroxylase MiaE [Pseudomonadales bacterium]|nr:tRNA isopentenyl-2-thiomethyl-A-37 hydroxylase MiaE [Pseudomonadales bacterium]